MKLNPKTAKQRGISLFEALITIVILAFGILGLAKLQAQMQKAEVESYARSQALVLLDDMAARVSANRANAATYVTASYVGTGDPPTNCSATYPVPGKDRDLCEWSEALKGNTELDASAIAVGAMIGGRGCIEDLGIDPPSYRVEVAWQGLSPTVVPSVGCAATLYGGNDAYRRVVTKVVSVASLAPGP